MTSLHEPSRGWDLILFFEFRRREEFRLKEIEISFFTLSLGIMAALSPPLSISGSTAGTRHDRVFPPLPLPHLHSVLTVSIEHRFSYSLG